MENNVDANESKDDPFTMDTDATLFYLTQGVCPHNKCGGGSEMICKDCVRNALERVRSHEREECALIAEDVGCGDSGQWGAACKDVANEIRTRKTGDMQKTRNKYPNPLKCRGCGSPAHCPEDMKEFVCDPCYRKGVRHSWHKKDIFDEPDEHTCSFDCDHIGCGEEDRLRKDKP